MAYSIWTRARAVLNLSSFLTLLVKASANIIDGVKRAKINVKREKTLKEIYASRLRLFDVYFHTAAVKKLHIGAGTNLLDGWLNTDIHPVSPEFVFLNAVDEFPFEDALFDYVFCEHMIEHITYPEALNFLHESFRILMPGGKIRISTPDAVKIVGLLAPEKTEMQKKYIAWSARELLGLYSPESSEFQTRRPDWDIDHRHIQRFYPETEVDADSFVVNNFFRSFGHRFIHTKKSLQALLQEAGFTDVVQFTPGESNDEHLRGLESHSRLIGEEMNEYESMVLEASRL